MIRKPEEPTASRQMVALRPPPELRAQLEQAAQENGRPVSKEAEWRLAQSFVQASDPLPGIFSDEVRRALRGSQGLAQIVETIADVLLNTMQAARMRDRSEEDTRIALRAALNLVGDRYLWREGAQETPIEGPLASLGAHRLDYPPAHMGYEMANTRILALSLWRESDAAADAIEGRIRDLYSGAGRTVLAGPTEEEVEARRRKERDAAHAAVAAGDVQFESPDRMHLYKPVREDPETRGDEPAPRPLKDIMRR